MTGEIVVPMIILGAIAISSSLMYWHEHRLRVYAEMDLRYSKRLLKRYREHFSFLDKLWEDVKARYGGGP
jgi:hypothetical protein